MTEDTATTIRVMGRDISFELTELPISSLRYYLENPRINYLLTTHDGPVTQQVVEDKLLDRNTTKDLLKDIESNGGLIEEILVIDDEVVEGNTRLAVYRRLHKKDPQDARWSKIPAKVLSNDITAAELFFILGTFHVKGKNEWGAYEKAAYVHRMVRELNYSPKEVAKQLSHQARTVEAMLAAYEAMRDCFLPEVTVGVADSDVQDALRKYSYFEAFFRKPELAARAKQTPAFVDDFSDWVRRGVFPKAEQVRDLLPKVLDHKRAQDKFMDLVDSDPPAALYEAELVLNAAKPEKTDPFYKQVKEFRDLIRKTSPEKVRSELEQSGSFGASRKTELKRCLHALQGFCRAIGMDK